MSDSNPLVRINIDTVDEIEKLYGVGRILAERMVSYRNANRYFRCPEDLAKVDGITLQLAITLSPHIDWQLPAEPIRHKKRDWTGFLFGLVLSLVNIWLIANTFLPYLYSFVAELQSGISFFYEWILLLSNILIGISLLFFLLGTVIASIDSLTSDYLLSKKLLKAQFNFLVWGVVVGVIMVIGQAVDFSLDNSWQIFFDNPLLVTMWLFIALTLFSLLPFILVTRKLKLSTNKFVSWLPDAALSLLCLVAGLAAWFNREDLPLLMLVGIGVPGIYVLSVSLDSIRTGRSLYFTIATSLLETYSQVDDLSIWKRWINARLPDPEQQKALKRALEEMHPPSRFNTITAAIVFGAGGWLVLTALNGIVEWLIANVLDKYFP